MAAKNNEVTETTLICRICLMGNQDKFCSLFEPYRDYSPAYHINSITNLRINEEDSLPDRICTSCLLELENAINFKIKCESSDAYLKKTLDDINAETNLSKLELPDCNDVIVKEEKDEDSPVYEEYNWDSDINNEMECILKPCIDNHVPDDDVNVKVDVPAKCPVICHDCGGVFKSKCKLRVHWKKEHKIYLDCDLCKARYCTMKALRNHKLSNPEKCKKLNLMIIDGFGKDRVFKCPLCKYSVKGSCAIIQHLTTHSGEKKFKCSMCDKCFTQRAGLDVHLQNVHKIIKKTLTCDICGLVIHSQSKFTVHMKRKHSSTKFECDFCHKKFKLKESLIYHINRHQGVKNYGCKYCLKLFFTPSEAANHKTLRHFNRNINKIKVCPLCPYKSFSKAVMDLHIGKHESGTMSCEICGSFHNTELLLWTHKICHLSTGSIARRTCPFCKRMYEKYKLLRTHMSRVHLKKDLQKYDLDEVITRIRKAWAADNNQSNHRLRQKNIINDKSLP